MYEARDWRHGVLLGAGMASETTAAAVGQVGGGIVVSHSLRVGGGRFDEAIATYIRKKYNLMIGERTAEEVKIQIGTALPLERELTMEVRGRDLIAGLPRTIPITTIRGHGGASRSRSSSWSPRCARSSSRPRRSSRSDIIDKGMVMSGGGALLRNADKLLTQVTGVPCHVAENSLNCVALGTGLALEHFDFFKKSLRPARPGGPRPTMPGRQPAARGLHRPALPLAGRASTRWLDPRDDRQGRRDRGPDPPGDHRP